MPRRKSKLRCPICHQPVEKSSPEIPFCSDRCRLLDLGRWLSGQYRIAAAPRDAEEALGDAEAPEAGGDNCK